MGDLKAKSKELRQINQYLSHIFNNKLRQYDSLRIKSFLENILVIQKVFATDWKTVHLSFLTRH